VGKEGQPARIDERAGREKTFGQMPVSQEGKVGSVISKMGGSQEGGVQRKALEGKILKNSFFNQRQRIMRRPGFPKRITLKLQGMGEKTSKNLEDVGDNCPVELRKKHPCERGNDGKECSSKREGDPGAHLPTKGLDAEAAQHIELAGRPGVGRSGKKKTGKKILLG